MTTVLLTDRAWPDDWVERDVLDSAGLRLVAGPPDPADAATIDAVVAEPQPEADPHLLGTGIGHRHRKLRCAKGNRPHGRQPRQHRCGPRNQPWHAGHQRARLLRGGGVGPRHNSVLVPLSAPWWRTLTVSICTSRHATRSR